MARGDVRLDFETNDLVIKKDKLNKYSDIEYRVGGQGNYYMDIEVPSSYVVNVAEDTWKTFVAPVTYREPIDSSYNSYTLNVSYYYVDGNGLKAYLDSSLLSPLTEETISIMKVEDYNNFLLTLEEDEDLTFSLYEDSIGGDELYFVQKGVLGDFIASDDIAQNEYILMNVSEGSFLQNPTFGVGLVNYLQSPTSNDDIIQKVTDKFAQDSLRVLGIKMNNELLQVQSEEKNKDIDNGNL